MCSIPKAIIVVSYPGSPWFSDCMTSLQGVQYPIVVCWNLPENNAYDAAGLYLAQELGIEEFFLLHDSTLVKDVQFINEAMKQPGCIALAPGGLMLMGKYSLADMPPLPPRPVGKRAAIEVELSYKNQVPWRGVLEPSMNDGPVREMKHGQERMRIEGDNIIKWKYHYDMSKVTD